MISFSCLSLSICLQQMSNSRLILWILLNSSSVSPFLFRNQSASGSPSSFFANDPIRTLFFIEICLFNNILSARSRSTCPVSSSYNILRVLSSYLRPERLGTRIGTRSKDGILCSRQYSSRILLLFSLRRLASSSKTLFSWSGRVSQSLIPSGKACMRLNPLSILATLPRENIFLGKMLVMTIGLMYFSKYSILSLVMPFRSLFVFLLMTAAGFLQMRVWKVGGGGIRYLPVKMKYFCAFRSLKVFSSSSELRLVTFLGSIDITQVRTESTVQTNNNRGNSDRGDPVSEPHSRLNLIVFDLYCLCSLLSLIYIVFDLQTLMVTIHHYLHS